MERVAIHRVARSWASLRPLLATQQQQLFIPHARALSTVPRIAEVSFWKSLVPKPFRRDPSSKLSKAKTTKQSWFAKEWNPATFFVMIFLLIGSMSIQMISLRKNFDAFTRRTDVRIGLLREVVERLQNGEEVDVEKVLGSGDSDKEAAWQEVLEEIEKDTAIRENKKAKKKKQQQEEEAKSKAAQEASSAAAKAISTPQHAIQYTEPVQESSTGRSTDFF